MIPYTYLIGWSILGLYYYGVRYATGCHPGELFVSYFTSSKYVEELIQSTGLPDIIEIRKTFHHQNDAIKWEVKVLRRMNVLQNNKWLNKSVGGAIIYTPDIRARMSKSKIGISRKPFTVNHRLNLSLSHTGKTYSNSHRAAIAEGQRKRHERNRYVK